MHKMVKAVFLAIMGAVLAYTLFVVFFGNRVRLFGANVAGNWNGVLHYAALAMEKPIARYYYDNCYLPTAHMNDGVDEALGYSIETNYNTTDLAIGYSGTGVSYSNEVNNGYMKNSAVVEEYWLDTTKSASGWY